MDGGTGHNMDIHLEPQRIFVEGTEIMIRAVGKNLARF